MTGLTHVDDGGREGMVDVSARDQTLRIARTAATLICAPVTLAQERSGSTPKGAVIATAKLAGVRGTKRAAELIPLYHPPPLTHVAISIEVDDALPGSRILGETRTFGRTGVPMEALTAVTIACLTLFDMLNAIDRTMRIGNPHVVATCGGRSGDWSIEEQAG